MDDRRMLLQATGIKDRAIFALPEAITIVLQQLCNQWSKLISIQEITEYLHASYRGGIPK
ncbi:MULTISPECIES: hypothetical protein [Nitrosomonas]|uniref:Uncharacterized protein n=1 Tax=Nitrosomonas communis TaxID=44574 RepID=A0A0F7KDQ3_9PROT|nr:MULTISPECIES: hypothetical protein [Nitrosomonas]AKH37656.1 hypothetical protein AAW31_07325 [Nitrosomonas communis]UVS62958.1 hypothetical protein NX761_07635 [Nitrosomonas sp. PLL12]